MSDKSVAEKARVRPGTAVAAPAGAPEGLIAGLGFAADTRWVDATDAQIVLMFVTTHAELETALPAAVGALAPGAAVWVFFRKGSRAAGFDVNRDSVWALADTLGLRPLGLMSVDDTWSVFRLKPGS